MNTDCRCSLRTVSREDPLFKSGETFEVEDEWSSSASAPRFLKDAWVGSTEFHVRESDGKS